MEPKLPYIIYLIAILILSSDSCAYRVASALEWNVLYMCGMFFLRMQTCHDAFIFRICATFSFLDGVLVGSTPFERTDNEIKILNESMTTPLSVVARDGIEPPTQAFSGLCSTDWATWPYLESINYSTLSQIIRSNFDQNIVAG